MNVETLQTTQGTTIAGPLLITPRAFGDDRGWFFESWNQTRFNEAVGQTVEFSPRQPLKIDPRGFKRFALPIGP